MVHTPKPLADGQLAATSTVLYTVPDSTRVFVSCWRCHNTGAGSNTVQLWVNTTGTSRKIANVALATQETLVVLDGEVMHLAAGDMLVGQATNASEVDFYISGVEET